MSRRFTLTINGVPQAERTLIAAPPVVLTPTLAGVSPSQAPVGSTITLVGTNFIGGMTVQFTGALVPVAATSIVAGSANVVVPANTTSGPVTVITSNGTSNAQTFTVGALIPWPVTLPIGTVPAGRGQYMTFTADKYQGRPFNAADYSVFTTVTTGAELQTALNTMVAGTCIVISGTATFSTVEGFILPRLTGPAAIVSTAIRNGAGPVANGVRVLPANEAAMPKIRVTGNGAASCFRYFGEPRAATIVGHYGFLTFAGLVLEDNGTNFPSMVALDCVSWTNSDSDPLYSTLANEPRQIVWDRCVIKSNAADTLNNDLGANIGLWRYGRQNALHGCSLYGFRGGGEPKAVLDAPGSGDHWADNCFFEAVGINYMPGGYSIDSADMRPEDIVFRRCHFFKRLSYVTEGRVKNLFEIKLAQRVLMDGCLFENSFAAAQVQAMVFLSVNQGNRNVAPDIHFSQNVTVRYCAFRNCDSLFTFAGGASGPFPGDPNYGTGTPFQRVYLQHVAAEGGAHVPDVRLSLMVSNGTTLDHCTLLRKGNNVASFTFTDFDSSTGISNFLTRDCVTEGTWRSTLGFGSTAMMALHTTNGIVATSMLIASGGANPAGNISLADIAAAGITDRANYDYTLLPSSPGKNTASDGFDMGVDAAGLATLTAGCASGSW